MILITHFRRHAVVAPDAAGEAAGQLYLDDEITLAHETKNEFSLRRFSYRQGILSCDGINSDYERANTVERILITGVQRPSRVLLRESEAPFSDLVFFYDATARVLTIKKPDVRVDRRWTITLEEM